MIPRYFGYMFRQVRQRLLPAVRLPHWPLLLLRSPKKRFYGHFSRGMERIPHLAAFLGQDVVRLPRTGEQPLFWKYFEPHCTTLLAWGLKEATGKPAEQASGQSGLPMLASGAVIPPNQPFAAILGDQTTGRNIETPEALMRSRYSAYAKAEIDHLLKSTAPSQRESIDRNEMRQWAERSKWLGLEILDALPAEATVSESSREVLEVVLALPPKYKDVIYLFFYEGYQATENHRDMTRA